MINQPSPQGGADFPHISLLSDLIAPQTVSLKTSRPSLQRGTSFPAQWSQILIRPELLVPAAAAALGIQPDEIYIVDEEAVPFHPTIEVNLAAVDGGEMTATSVTLPTARPDRERDHAVDCTARPRPDRRRRRDLAGGRRGALRGWPRAGRHGRHAGSRRHRRRSGGWRRRRQRAVVSQGTQYTVVLHMRYSVMWCLRYGVIVCCVCVLCLCVIHWGCIEGGVSCHTVSSL